MITNLMQIQVNPIIVNRIYPGKCERHRFNCEYPTVWEVIENCNCLILKEHFPSNRICFVDIVFHVLLNY